MNLTQLVLHLNIYALINVSDAMSDAVEDARSRGGAVSRRKSLATGAGNELDRLGDPTFYRDGFSDLIFGWVIVDDLTELG